LPGPGKQCLNTVPNFGTVFFVLIFPSRARRDTDFVVLITVATRRRSCETQGFRWGLCGVDASCTARYHRSG